MHGALAPGSFPRRAPLLPRTPRWHRTTPMYTRRNPEKRTPDHERRIQLGSRSRVPLEFVFDNSKKIEPQSPCYGAVSCVCVCVCVCVLFYLFIYYKIFYLKISEPQSPCYGAILCSGFALVGSGFAMLPVLYVKIECDALMCFFYK